ncbi:hypothetical protein LCE44_02535 [Vibrio harveyi]|nr:hypothetical protein [Vibrio harveyi]EMR34764.1 hypothetical protein MUQ_21715 [Vibrio harveyi CAIM 1792]
MGYMLLFHCCLMIAIWLFIFAPLFSNANTLTMNLVGKLEDRCEINFTSGQKIDLSDSNIKTLPLDIYCNQPLGVSVYSKNGGLKLDKRDDIPPFDYLFEININKANIHEEVKSIDLLSEKRFDSSGVIPFSALGEIRITLEDRLLYAGYYEDVIEIDVFPSINSVIN